MRPALVALALAAAPLSAQEDSSRARPSLIRPGGLLLFYRSEGPLSFVSTPGGLPKGARPLGELKGRACQHGLSVPLSLSFRAASLSGAAGDGGFRKVLEKMRKDTPGLSGLYDVKVDSHLLSVLGLYRRLCTEVTARGFSS